MTVLETDQLTELMRRKQLCLAQLHDLGRQQCDVVERGDVNDLLRILGAKQLLIGAMQDLERQLDPFRQQDPDARVWRSATHREACAKLVTDCELLFRAILEQERQSEAQLRRRRDDTEIRLTEAQAAEQVRGAYTHDVSQAWGTLDLTSEV